MSTETENATPEKLEKDAELIALVKVVAALQPIERRARYRVLHYARDRLVGNYSDDQVTGAMIDSGDIPF